MEEADIIYFDSIACNLATTSGNVPTATYNQTRTIPYLVNPEEYYGAIISFYINDTSIPVFIPDIQPYQSDPNLTIYSVTLSYSTSSVTTFVEFIPQNQVAPVPLGPSLYPNGIQNNANGYYNVQSYAYFMGLVNTAFATCYTALKVLQPTLTASQQPKMVFDSVTSLFTIAGKNTLYNLSNTTPVKVFMNAPLYHLFNFPNYYTLANSLVQNQIIFDSNVSVVDTVNDVIATTQQNDSISLWNTITDLVITSTYIPSNQVLVGVPQIQYNGAPYPVATNNSTSRQILLDFPFQTNLINVPITYQPTAQYQLFSMNSSEPLYNLDWQMWYRARTGLLYPVYLNSGTTASLKLGFFKKDKFNNLKGLR